MLDEAQGHGIAGGWACLGAGVLCVGVDAKASSYEGSSEEGSSFGGGALGVVVETAEGEIGAGEGGAMGGEEEEGGLGRGGGQRWSRLGVRRRNIVRRQLPLGVCCRVTCFRELSIEVLWIVSVLVRGSMLT